jgi:drug/metabolite transporter (DMT)-like permease
VTRRELLIGNLAALVASSLFGGAVVATRVTVEDVPPLTLALLRFGQGGLVLIAVLWLFRRDLLRVAHRDLRLFALLGALLYSLFPLLFNTSLKLTTASRGAVVLATMPLWSALLGRIGRRESLATRQLLGVALSIAGVAGVFAESAGGLAGGGRAMAGNGLMIAAASFGALYGVLAKPLLRRTPVVTVTGYGMLIGAALLLPAAVVEGFPGNLSGLPVKTWLLVLFLGIFGGAAGYWLITFALARLTPTQAVAYINVNPLVATAFGALFLDETLTVAFVAGFALVAAGLVLANWPAARATVTIERNVEETAPRPSD